MTKFDNLAAAIANYKGKELRWHIHGYKAIPLATWLSNGNEVTPDTKGCYRLNAPDRRGWPLKYIEDFYKFYTDYKEWYDRGDRGITAEEWFVMQGVHVMVPVNSE